MKHQTLFLMMGYPGAGKTTAAKILAEITGADHLWADKERRERFQKPQYSHNENITLYDELNKRVEVDIKAGKSVIYDTNFSLYKDRQKLRSMAAKHNVPTVVIWVTTHVDLAKVRATKHSHGQETRVWGNMTEADFERMSKGIEPPHHDEHIISFDGSDISRELIIEKLAHNQHLIQL